jgi:hypothetical protein
MRATAAQEALPKSVRDPYGRGQVQPRICSVGASEPHVRPLVQACAGIANLIRLDGVMEF